MAEISLVPGWYYIPYETFVPNGPFHNREEAFKAAGGADVEEEDYFAVLEVVFDNFAWGE